MLEARENLILLLLLSFPVGGSNWGEAAVANCPIPDTYAPHLSLSWLERMVSLCSWSTMRDIPTSSHETPGLLTAVDCFDFGGN